jgi:hypothetical protein
LEAMSLRGHLMAHRVECQNRVSLAEQIKAII